MNIVLIFTLLLLSVFKTNAKETTETNNDQEAITTMTYNKGSEVGESNTNIDGINDAVSDIKTDTEMESITIDIEFDAHCDSCSQSRGNSDIKICVNHFLVDVTFSKTIPFLWESEWVYNDGELTNIICTVSPDQRITMSYYEYEGMQGHSLKKIFTSTSIGSVKAYIKLEEKKSPTYVECQSAPLKSAVPQSQIQYVTDRSRTNRLFLFPSKTTNNLVKVNDFILPTLCTVFSDRSTSVYEYNAVNNEALNIILRPYSRDIQCNTKGYRSNKLFNPDTNITSFNVGLLFDSVQPVYMFCYRKSNYTIDQIALYKKFHVLVYRYQKLFKNAKIWVEGIQWQFTLEMYTTYHGIDKDINDTSTTTVIKYLYHGEELKLTCYSYYEVANWAYSDKVIYKEINSVKCRKRPKGCLYKTTSSFVVKEFYSDLEMKCTSSGGNVFIVELKRETGEGNVASKTISTDEMSNVGHTMTISVTVLVAIMIVVFGFTFYKVVQVRNKRKLEQKVIAANRIIYEPKYAENIYESIKHENPKRAVEPLADISSRPPIPLPSEKQEDKQPSVDISQRPPLPLPLEEEDNLPYRHYDTPYEYRLFRYGRRTGPPNRSRTIKHIL